MPSSKRRRRHGGAEGTDKTLRKLEQKRTGRPTSSSSCEFNFVAREEAKSGASSGKKELRFLTEKEILPASMRAEKEGIYEWEMALPSPETDSGKSFLLAAEQAERVHAKYRYGAVLVTGSDFIPLRVGSNSKPFKRKEIHAEAATLKGLPSGGAKGKTMIIVRLPPRSSKVKLARNDTSKKSVVDEADEDDSDFCIFEKFRTSESVAEAEAVALHGRYLNARPCENCYKKMETAGVRLCVFTKPSKGRIGCVRFRCEQQKDSGNHHVENLGKRKRKWMAERIKGKGLW
eukprot:jgi/Bigna1/139198/aug1.49_g13906